MCSLLRKNLKKLLRILKCILIELFSERKIPNPRMIGKHGLVTTLEQEEGGQDGTK